MADELQIEGLEGVLEKMHELPIKMQKRAVKRAVRKGAKVVQKDARARARVLDDPSSPQKIWKNIAVRSGKTRDKSVVMMRVGVQGGARPVTDHSRDSLPGGNTTYWRFVEFGTVDTPAEPFMRPAMNERTSEVFQVTARSMHEELDKELRKL